jgi:putative membrane-bound dehydrogenase-like protein
MRSLLLFTAGLSLPLLAFAAPPPYDPLNDPGRPIAKTPSRTPAETAKALEVPPGFTVEALVGEPQIRQPIAHTMDDRGRLWILENTNYPICPGEPKDRILMLESTKGDGNFDKQTVFYDKLTFASGIAVGFGGVYVGAPPNLLFIPDQNGDGVPDGEPQILLDGWGDEDKHETLNDFVWGPDGWLYGTQGIFTFSKVGAPGTPEEKRVKIDAGVWRFHPQNKTFERYCEGASNQWGIDWNDHGQQFFAACVIPHVWQCIQGARYQRQAGKPSSPYTYDDIKTIADFEYEKRAYCGAMVYLGGLFPAELRDTFFFHDIHINKMRNERMERAGSGYEAKRNLDFVVSHDPWFRGLSPQYGPDGAVYVNDWYDKVPCYQQRDSVDRTNGRMYRISYAGCKPVSVDLTKASNAELVQMQLNPNDWYVRHARRLLQERGPDAETVRSLEKMVRENPDDTRQLRALWALHSLGGVAEPLALEMLGSKSEYVRGWMIQMLCEKGHPSDAVLARLNEMAESDPSSLVRLYLASAAQRLELDVRWPLLTALAAHGEDDKDHNLPLMLWYGIEPVVAQEFEKGAAFLGAAQIGKVQEFTARRMVSAALAPGAPSALPLLLKAIGADAASASVAPQVDKVVREVVAAGEPKPGTKEYDVVNERFVQLRLNVLRGINAALKGQRSITPPAEWEPLYARLQESKNEDIRQQAQMLAATFGGTVALEELRKVLADRKAEIAQRRAALDSLVSAKDASAVPLMLGALFDASALRGPVLRALSTFDDPAIPAKVLANYGRFGSEEKRDALASLTTRPSWAQELLNAIDQKTVARTDISAPIARQLQDLKDKSIDEWLAKNWGSVRTLAADKQKEIVRLKAALTPAVLGKGDPSHGRALFAQTCAICHTVFGAGAKIGPELPGAFEDIDYLLQNIIDPNAIIGKDYQQNLVETKDGQTLAGIIAGDDANTLTLKTLAGPVTVQKKEIAKQTLLDISLMPEGLLAGRSTEDVRDLFVYLARHGQVPVLADANNMNDFFNGTDLSHWIASTPKAWKVESGEIVGYGETKPTRLDSDMVAKEGLYSFEVALVGGDAEAMVLLSNPAAEVTAKLRFRGDRVEVNEPAGWREVMHAPGPYQVRVNRSGAVGESWSLTVAGTNSKSLVSTERAIAAQPNAGVVLGFEIESPKTEVRIKKLRLEPFKP